MDPTGPDPASLSLSQILHVDEICQRFERAWREAAAGQGPSLEAYLSDTPEPARTRLFRELLRLEVYYRGQAGEVMTAGDWLARFPGLDPAWLGPGDPAVPGYKIVAELGRGGMGAVFKGHDTALGRDVAGKVLLAEHHEYPELRQRFVQEARIGGQLQHPGIVPVYAQGEDGGGRPYFTMRLVEGRTLAALLRQRADATQELPRLLKVFEQVCQTLAYAHSRGVIHRDLKPGNV